tara:strand:+ start:72 stop:422 length:351 start_codon:yes stop_codon:yes gene_type:complete
MNKANFILGFKSSFFLVIPFLVTSCGGGVTQKYTDGSKFYFKGENINCEWYESSTRVLDCTAYGVRTYLNGYKENYSDGYSCRREDYNGNVITKGYMMNPTGDNFVCEAARRFGKY